MRILITGAGEVGFQLANALSQLHDVTVIDQDRNACDRLDEMDVGVLQGNAANAQLLIDAGVVTADIVVAVTGNDEVNIITCIIANHLGSKKTIARVSNSDYIDQPMKDRKKIGIGLMICPELIMAEKLVTTLYFPSMVESCKLAGGTLEMVELEALEDGPLLGAPDDIDLPDNCTLAAIKRNDNILMTSDVEFVNPQDHLILICDVNSVSKLRKLTHKETSSHKVMIVGGGVVGFYLAKWLERMDFSLKLVEIDNQRCQELADELPETLILNSDGTDISLLKSENAGSMDIVFSVTGNDEKNLLCSLLAKQLGAKKIVARVDSIDYIDLFEMVGVDRAISPGVVTVESVLRRVTDEKDVITIGGKNVELLELKANKSSTILGKNALEKMPRGATIGMIIRGDQFINPSPESEIKEYDRVFILALPSVKPKVEALFTV